MKNILTIALCLAGVLALVAGCTSKSKKAEQAAAEAAAAAAEKEQKQMETLANLPEEPVFDIITSLGTIKIKLYKETPKHRDNFAKLAVKGYYDGILFHRVINGFMIQAGDPLTKNPEMSQKWGTGGPGYTVPAEFVPALKHKKGALAAARQGDRVNPAKESSGSQFYLVQDADACSQLDGDYTVYGETLEGLDVIDKIAAVQVDRSNRPVQEVKIIKIVLAE